MEAEVEEDEECSHNPQPGRLGSTEVEEEERSALQSSARKAGTASA